MHDVVSVARWLSLLILSALLPKILKAIFTTVSPAATDPKESEIDKPERTPFVSEFDPGQVRDDRFRLESLLWPGKVAETWRAEDLASGSRVVVRFLLKRHIGDISLVRRFAAASQAAGKLWDEGVPPVTFVGKDTAAPYYVCEYLEGKPLSEHVLLQKDHKQKASAIDGIARIASCLDKAHAIGLVHATITPDDILVHRQKWTLVDLDLACSFIDRNESPPLFPSLAFSAPECFQEGKIGPQADVYNLARLLLFVYCDGELPTPFNMTNKDVLDRVNASLELKRVLRRAMDVDPELRYETVEKFVEALKTAQESEKTQAAIVGVYLQEKDKILRVLLHCSVGVLSVMLLTRAIMTFLAIHRHSQFGWVQLSDRPVVGAFHGLLGSVIWGCLIPLGFLLQWPLHARRTSFGPLLASVIGALCGFLGGVLCSYMSVLVTSLVILKHLGWLLPQASETSLDRLGQTIHLTRMFWAFPLEGMWTGLGVGLYLALKMKRLRGDSTKGLEPMPAKAFRSEPGALQAVLEFVAKGAWLQTFLLAPVAFSWVTAVLLRAHGVSLHNEWHRTLGEGFVQSVGATGLVTGFFYGIVAPAQERTRRGIWTTSIAKIQKRFLGFSKSVAG